MWWRNMMALLLTGMYGITKSGSSLFINPTGAITISGVGNVTIAPAGGGSVVCSAIFNIGGDCLMQRIAAGVITMFNNATWIQHSSGDAVLTANATKNTATLAVTNLSNTLIAGRTYLIRGLLELSNTVPGEGAQFDLGGGTGSATKIFLTATAKGGTAVAGTEVATSLTGAINYTSITGTTYVKIEGSIKVNAGGTFILRLAENTTVTGTVTLGAGSFISYRDALAV